ncbi:MAG: acetate--CoA ligase family protein [Nitrososphaeria archaeon]
MDASLRALYYPESISVVGVSPRADNFATIIFSNLMEAKERGLLKADVYPVNPLYEECLGHRCLRSVPPTDLMIVSVPSSAVWGYLKSGDEVGVKASIVISGGFTEAGGERLLKEKLRMRVLGPNTIGIVNPYNGINTLFLPKFKKRMDGSDARSLPELRQGRVAIITQSGGVSVSILDELLSNGIGISSLTCLGNSEDITVSDVLEFLAGDENTEAVAMYIEGIRDGERFMRAASELTRRKKAFALVAGATEAGRRATMSHTASIVTNYDIYVAAMKQTGIVRVQSLRELMDVVRTFERNGLPKGREAVVITNSGGAGVLAAEALARNGVGLPDVGDVLRPLKDQGIIPRVASLHNPVDVSASGTDESIISALRRLTEAGHRNFVVISTHYPPGITDKLPSSIRSVAASSGAFVLAVELGSTEWSEHLRRVYEGVGIPAFETPEEASAALASLIRAGSSAPSWKPVELAEEPGALPEGPEAAKILERFGIRAPEWGWIDEADLERLPYPVALKVHRKDLVHKTERGALRLGIRSSDEARAAWEELSRAFPGGRVYYQKMIEGLEVRLGFFRDESFGPVISVGLGGIYTELFRISSLRICPVSEQEAAEMLRETKLYEALSGYRGRRLMPPEELARAMAGLSEWIYANRRIRELEINPLIVSDAGAFAVDVRIAIP